MRPEFQKSVCPRLKSAVGCIQNDQSQPIRTRLERAAQIIAVFPEDDFAADFRSEFRELYHLLTASGSISDTIAAMSEEAAMHIADKIVELHRAICSA